jgi:hypothetical protein
MRSLVLWFLIACSGGSGGDVTPDNLPAELAEATCAKLADCCDAAEFMEATLGADNEAECRVLFTSFGGLITTALEDSIAKGRVVFHGDRMRACLDAIAGLTCAEYHDGGDELAPDGCENPFDPLVAAGGECAQDFDCTSAFCDGGSIDFDGNITYGACADRIAIGGACTDSDACVGGAFCDFSTTEPACATKLADGAACTSNNQCASGNCDTTCGPNTTCDGT